MKLTFALLLLCGVAGGQAYLFRWAIYRRFMQFAHRHNWHHAPRIGPFEDGSTQLWCKWCGFRMTEPPHVPGQLTVRFHSGELRPLSDSGKRE